MTDINKIVGCRYDTDGDGNCHIHPQGCLKARVDQIVDELQCGSHSPIDDLKLSEGANKIIDVCRFVHEAPEGSTLSELYRRSPLFHAAITELEVNPNAKTAAHILGTLCTAMEKVVLRGKMDPL